MRTSRDQPDSSSRGRERSTREVYRFGRFELDVAARRLLDDGEPVAIRRQVFDLLHVLVARAPDAVSAKELLEALWPDVVVGEENLKQRIMQLRRVLGDDAVSPTYVETIRGWGYRFASPVEDLREVPVDRVAGPATPTETARGPRHKLLTVGALGLLFLALVWGFWRTQRREPRPLEPEVSAAGEIEAKARTLMYNFSHPGDLALSIELWNELAELRPDYAPALSGRASAATMLVWNTSPDAELLEAAENDARAALGIDPKDVYSQVALSTVHQLRGLIETAEVALAKARTLAPDDPWILQLHARYLMDNRGAYREAERLARNALTKDAAHFPAWFQLGWALIEQERFDEAEAAFEKSLALQPDFVAGLFGLSQVYCVTGRFSGAVALLERALEIDPGSPQARFFLAISLHHLDRHRRALDILEGALEGTHTNPLRGPMLFLQALQLGALGRIEERDTVLTECEEMFKRQPGVAWAAQGLAGIAVIRGDRRQALAWLKTARVNGLHSLFRLKLDPSLDPLRTDPAFLEIEASLRDAVRSR